VFDQWDFFVWPATLELRFAAATVGLLVVENVCL